MESPREDVDNIFNDYENRENGEEVHGTENVDESNNENSTGVKIQPPKRIIKNPRLKFDPERLCGERGIPVLVDHFKNVKFKGKGHEKEDLDKLLSKLEHWTHRLFPSMRFEDCLHQIEKLGTKRPVQTCIRKIRLDMPILTSDFVKDDEEDDVKRNEDTEPVEVDAFDQLIGESHNFNPVTTSESMMGSDSLADYLSPVQRDPVPEQRGQVLGSYGSSLTEEQKERLEYNRMLAIERRKARLAALQQDSLESTLESNKRDSTPDDPVQQSFDSLLEKKENKSDDIHINNTQFNNMEGNENLSELNNSNSDNLGLDDLIDLVDEEEPAVDENATASFSEQSATICDQSGKNITHTNELSEISKMEFNDSNLDVKENCNVSDIMLRNEMVLSNKVDVSDRENLELESLMDLVNEDAEDCQDPANFHHVKKDTKELEAMDF